MLVNCQALRNCSVLSFSSYILRNQHSMRLKCFNKDLTVVNSRRQKRNPSNFHFLAHTLKTNIYLSDWKSIISFSYHRILRNWQCASLLISWHPVCNWDLTRLRNQTLHLKKNSHTQQLTCSKAGHHVAVPKLHHLCH